MSDLAGQLAALGFSEYEARVYVALQQRHPVTGYQLAKDSGVPRSMIYEVLGKLVARGAALTQSFGDSMRYAPVPPDLLLDRVRHQFEDTLDRLAEGFRQAAVTPVTPGQTWEMTGKDNVLAYAREMIKRARHEVALAASDDDELDELLAALHQARSRKVALVVVSSVPYDAADLPVVVHANGMQLRHVLGHGLALAVDGREALIGEVDRSQSALWTTHPYAVAWIRWCLKQELAGLPVTPARPARGKRKRTG